MHTKEIENFGTDNRYKSINRKKFRFFKKKAFLFNEKVVFYL